jgi:hypothetical protein
MTGDLPWTEALRLIRQQPSLDNAHRIASIIRRWSFYWPCDCPQSCPLVDSCSLMSSMSSWLMRKLDCWARGNLPKDLLDRP